MIVNKSVDCKDLPERLFKFYPDVVIQGTQTVELNMLPTLMQDHPLIIREAEFSDVLALSALMNELGYETRHEEMEARFERIHNHTDYKTFVAVIGSQTAGMIGLTRNYFYEQNGI